MIDEYINIRWCSVRNMYHFLVFSLAPPLCSPLLYYLATSSFSIPINCHQVSVLVLSLANLLSVKEPSSTLFHAEAFQCQLRVRSGQVQSSPSSANVISAGIVPTNPIPIKRYTHPVSPGAERKGWLPRVQLQGGR